VGLHPLFTLGGRLQLCASMVRDQTALADVGTDHAYLPIWLAKQGRISKAVASDIRPGPLQTARGNIIRYRVQDIVTTRLSDGLKAILPNEAEDIVMAGMGGELIKQILSAAPWVKEGQRRLILQPMTSIPPLRCFLAEQGFAILREQAVMEENHVYTVMLAQYQPQEVGTGTLYPYLGKLDAKTADNREYMYRLAANLEKKARGLCLSGKNKDADALNEIIRQIREIADKGEQQ